jgi:hypothetical protein
MEDFEPPKLPTSRPQDIAQVCCSKTLVAYSDAYLGMIYLMQIVLLAVVACYAPLPFAAHYAAHYALIAVCCALCTFGVLLLIMRFWRFSAHYALLAFFCALCAFGVLLRIMRLWRFAVHYGLWAFCCALCAFGVLLCIMRL